MSVMCIILCLIAAYALAIFFSYFYWRRKGVPYKLYFPYIDGMLALVLNKIDITGYLTDVVYNNFSDSRYAGTYFFGNPNFLIKDFELIKEMFIKNFDHFADRPGHLNFDNEPLWSKNLLNLRGQPWREMRRILTPSFTGSQMKTVFLLIDECAKNYVDFISNEPDEVVEFELKELFKRFSIDVIANAAYGIQVNSLKDKNNDFYMHGRNINKFDGIWNMIKYSIITFAPKIATFLDIRFVNPKYSEYFKDLIKNSIDLRKQYNIKRNDIIQLLLKAKEKNEESMSEIDLISQAFGFLLGGTDSVSNAMYFLAYELAVNVEIQEKLRQEIVDSIEQNDVSYDLIMNLPYLDMVVSESLRKNSIFFGTNRICTKPYQIKPTNSNEQPINLNVGDVLLISLCSLHMDPKYFPNPEKFDPERFSTKNFKNTVPYFPFGFGPRMCIAYRLALLEIKTLFFHLVLNFEIVPTKRSVVNFSLLKGVMRTEPDVPLWFGFKKLKV